MDRPNGTSRTSTPTRTVEPMNYYNDERPDGSATGFAVAFAVSAVPYFVLGWLFGIKGVVGWLLLSVVAGASILAGVLRR